MTIYAYALNDAYDVRDCFRKADRDYYPIEVYQYIFDTEEELSACSGQARELDVIAWCCSISETDLESENRPLRERGLKGDNLYTLEDLSDMLEKETSIIHIDEDEEVIYYLAY